MITEIMANMVYQFDKNKQINLVFKN